MKSQASDKLGEFVTRRQFTKDPSSALRTCVTGGVRCLNARRVLSKSKHRPNRFPAQDTPANGT